MRLGIKNALIQHFGVAKSDANLMQKELCLFDAQTVSHSFHRRGDVVQLVRTLPCHGRGRGFESRRPRHSFHQVERMAQTRTRIVSFRVT